MGMSRDDLEAEILSLMDEIEELESELSSKRARVIEYQNVLDTYDDWDHSEPF